MDPYRILGLSLGCTLDEVKRAYRARVRQVHPDLGGDEAAFIEVCEAYKLVLNDVARRQALRGSTATQARNHESSVNHQGPVVAPEGPVMWPVRDRTSTARPADPLWDPELILADHPVWIGHAARPPNPDWEPELIIRDEEFPDRGESREQEKTSAAVDSAFPDRAHYPTRPAGSMRQPSRKELVLGIVILLCMMAIAVTAFFQIVWHGAAQQVR